MSVGACEGKPNAEDPHGEFTLNFFSLFFPLKGSLNTEKVQPGRHLKIPDLCILSLALSFNRRQFLAPREQASYYVTEQLPKVAKEKQSALQPTASVFD